MIQHGWGISVMKCKDKLNPRIELGNVILRDSDRDVVVMIAVPRGETLDI
jgi:hypothetical protein